MSAHPPDADLEKTAYAALDPDEQDRVHAHLAGCAACRDRTALFAKARATLSRLLRDAPAARRPSAAASRWLPLGIVAAAAFAAWGLWYWQPLEILRGPARAQDRVADLLQALEADDAARRDAAQAELARLGRDVRPALEAALPRLGVEAQGRIRAVLKGFLLLDQEEDAVRAIRAGFPPFRPAVSPESFATHEGQTVAEAIRAASRAYGVTIEVYPGDDDLRRRAEQTPVAPGLYQGHGLSGLLLELVTKPLEAACVAEQKRIVIVRLTPRLLVEGRRQEAKSAPWRTSAFYGTSSGTPMTEFLMACAEDDGPLRARWVDALAALAADPGAAVDDRRDAAVALGQFFDLRFEDRDDHHPDVLKALMKIAEEASAPAPVRREAIVQLVACNQKAAWDYVAAQLRGNDPELRKRLLGRTARALNLAGDTRMVQEGDVFTTVTQPWNPAWTAKLVAALRLLASSADAYTAVAAASSLYLLGDKTFAPVLAATPVPQDRDTLDVLLEGLSYVAVDDPGRVRARLAELTAHPESGVRLRTAFIFGRFAGGKDRGADVQGALRLLDDPEAVVRWAAARSLITIYTASASEPYADGRAEALEKVRLRLRTETHPKVRKELEQAVAAW